MEPSTPPKICPGAPYIYDYSSFPGPESSSLTSSTNSTEGALAPPISPHADLMHRMRRGYALGRQNPERAAIRALLAVLLAKKEGGFSMAGVEEDLFYRRDSALEMAGGTLSTLLREAEARTARDDLAEGAAVEHFGEYMGRTQGGNSAKCPSGRACWNWNACSRARDTNTQPTRISALQKLPRGLQAAILKDLDDIVDVHSAMTATRCFRDAFCASAANNVERLVPATIWGPDREVVPEVFDYCRQQEYGVTTSKDEENEEGTHRQAPSTTQQAINLLTLTTLVIDHADVGTQLLIREGIRRESAGPDEYPNQFELPVAEMQGETATKQSATRAWRALALVLDSTSALQTLQGHKTDLNYFAVRCLGKMTARELAGIPVSPELTQRIEDIKATLARMKLDKNDKIWNWAQANLPSAWKYTHDFSGFVVVPKERGNAADQFSEDLTKMRTRLLGLD